MTKLVKKTIFIALLFILVAPKISAEVWSATSVAWLSTGDDGKFINPRVLTHKDEFLGTAWEERHKEWSRAGVTLYGSGQWFVYPLSSVKKIQGIAATTDKEGHPIVVYGSPSGIYVATLVKEKWQEDKVTNREGNLLDITLSRHGLTVIYKKEKAAYIAQHKDEKWSINELNFPETPTQIGPGRLLTITGGHVTAVIKNKTHKDEKLFRLRQQAGGWKMDELPNHLAEMVNEGRFGLAHSEKTGLQAAFMRQRDKTLVLASLDEENCPLEEPDKGCVLRYPQVDLKLTKEGKPNVIYFAITPDGGLQIRLARKDQNGRWFSLMVDRTMSKNSLASCSLGLHKNEAPFLSYALGPARAVLLAYPKAWAPPGIGL